MTSSASKPAALYTGMLKASIISRQRWICWPMSQACWIGSIASSMSLSVSGNTGALRGLAHLGLNLLAVGRRDYRLRHLAPRVLVEFGDVGQRAQHLGLEVLEAGRLVGRVGDVTERGSRQVHGHDEMRRLEVVQQG